jgi:hypothetical protein
MVADDVSNLIVVTAQEMVMKNVNAMADASDALKQVA